MEFGRRARPCRDTDLEVFDKQTPYKDISAIDFQSVFFSVVGMDV